MKAATSNACRARIDRVLTHLADHLDADLSVAELARIAHFSPYHFHRMFRAMTGESVAALVRRLRLETAGRALREHDGSVTDVALAAGYGSPEAFTRAFQQAFGAAPSDYRRAVVAPRYLPPLSLELTLDSAAPTWMSRSRSSPIGLRPVCVTSAPMITPGRRTSACFAGR